MLTLLVALATAQSISLRDEGSPQGWVRIINCSGSGITCTADTATRIGTITISGGVGGGLPDTIPAVTFSSTSDLSAERVLSNGNYTVIDLGTASQAQVDWSHGLTCSSGQALTSSGTTAMACTSTLTASDVACAGTCVADGEISGVSGAKVSGAVATATALAADPSDCGAGTYATAIAASGALTCSTPVGTYSLPDSTSGTTGGIRLTGDLGGTATSPSVVDDSHAHTGTTISALDVGDITTGTLPAARGGLGQAQPTCSVGQYLTCNGTTCSCAFEPKVVTSNVTNSTTTPANITGLSWAVAANTEYAFRCTITSSGTATGGSRFNLNGPAGATTVSFATQRFTTTSAQTLLVLQAFSAAAQTAACTSGCNTTALPSLIYGTILNGANAGTAQLMLTSSTAGQLTTVFRGSSCVVY